MNKKISITIGIPAYNEGTRVLQLVESLQNQKQEDYQLEHIVVYLDGCSDDSKKLLESLKSNYLRIINSEKRQGKAHGLDTIIAQTETEGIVLMDADVKIVDVSFISKLIKPLQENIADLSAAKVLPIKAKGRFAQLLEISNIFKESLYESWKSGNNLYTCHGRAIAMTKTLYKKMSYKNIIADDALAYITAIKNKLKYKYVREAVVYYDLPENFQDHMKQSLRFLRSKKQLEQHESKPLLKREYSIPTELMVENLFKSMLLHPVSMIAYLGIFAFMKTVAIINTKQDNTWAIAQTSKL